MTATRPRDLLAVALVTAVLANLLIRLSYGSLPRSRCFAGATLGVLGAAEAVAGNMLRARIRRRPGTRPVQPLVAARAVLVAKASSLAGAIMAGVWGGLLAHVVPRAGDITAAGERHRRRHCRARVRARAGGRGAVAGALLPHARRARGRDERARASELITNVGCCAMTQATRVIPMPTPGRQRRAVLAPVLGLIALGVCGLVVLGIVGNSVGVTGVVVGALCALLPVGPVVATFLWIDRWEPEPPPAAAASRSCGAPASPR